MSKPTVSTNVKNNKNLSLNNQSVTHPFKVPKNYFESLPMEIQGKLSQPRSYSFSLYKKLALSTVSLAVLILVFFTLFNSENSTSKTTDQLLSSVSETSLIAYLDQLTLDEEDFFNELDVNYTLSANVLSKNIEHQSLKNYEDAYSIEDELDLYDYE